MSQLSSAAMVLAAGLGTRMRPLTLTKPKPLQEVGGRTMLDHALDRLVAAGIKHAIVNTFYLPELIENHLRGRSDITITISRETELLDTGGGIAKVVHLFEGKPFFALNADLPWTEGPTPSLQNMQNMWDEATMDALLLLMPTAKARGFDKTQGDYVLHPDNRAVRHDILPPRPYVYIGAQLIKAHLFAHPPVKVFSNRYIWDEVEKKRRLFGLTHQGDCYHVGTAEDLSEANTLLASGQGWGA